MPATDNKCAIALIGFGEVGTMLSRGFTAAGGYDVSVFDILMNDAGAKAAMLDKATSIGVRACFSAAEAAEGAAVVISAVTASSAVDVATGAGGYMKPGQFFLDINSVSPATKQHDCELVERSGADYVEAAVMAPVYPAAMKVPMVLGGKGNAALKQLLDPAGMRLTLGEHEIGKASALKMCRSVMVKGLEALTVECLTAARLYGIEDKILASLSESYPGLNWETLAGYNVERVVQHGRRRAAEMREVADTVAETGLAPLLSAAIAARMDWAADIVDAAPALKDAPEDAWRTTIDALAQGGGLRRPGKT